jgi:hypothetical protein
MRARDAPGAAALARVVGGGTPLVQHDGLRHCCRDHLLPAETRAEQEPLPLPLQVKDRPRKGAPLTMLPPRCRSCCELLLRRLSPDALGQC